MFRRLTTTVNNIKMSTPTIKKQHDELKRQMDASILDEKYQKACLLELRKEIDIALFDFLKMEKVEKSETQKVKGMLERNRELEDDLETLTAKTKELNRQVEDLKLEKDIKVVFHLTAQPLGQRSYSNSEQI